MTKQSTCEWIIQNDAIDWDQYVFSPDGFRSSLHSINLSTGTGPLNTPVIEIINPFYSSAQATSLNDDIGIDVTSPVVSQELLPVASNSNSVLQSSLSCHDSIDFVEVDRPTSDAQANNNTIENEPEREMDTVETEEIDQIINEPLSEEMADMMAVRVVASSIRGRAMTVNTQPPAKFRLRYESDEKRCLEKSRTKPTTINLPDLRECKLNDNQSFGLYLTLLTATENPLEKVYLHFNKLKYHANNAQQINHASVRIPLTQKDIDEGIKKLERLSIVKTEADEYTFDLIPFSPLTIGHQPEKYAFGNEQMRQAKKAKFFRKKYNLKCCRIHCQLAINQNNTWHMTNIACETNMMEGQYFKEMKSGKRPAPATVDDNQESEEEHSSTPKPSQAKRQKQSSPVMDGLPVTRVKDIIDPQDYY